MKKTIAAVALGLALMAGQAAASGQATPRVGDRLGAAAGDASQLDAREGTGLFFAAVLGIAIAIGSSDDSDSD